MDCLGHLAWICASNESGGAVGYDSIANVNSETEIESSGCA